MYVCMYVYFTDNLANIYQLYKTFAIRKYMDVILILGAYKIAFCYI